MSQAQADRNLLFGILAVQMDFINRDQLVSAMNSWVLDKSRSLGEILQSQGALAADDFSVLNAVVAKHIAKHGNDPAKSLATIAPPPPIRDAISRVIDVQVAASLGHVRTSAPVDEFATVGLSPSQAAAVAHANRFRVLRPHARGGLGEVFVARDEELNREVALKEIQNLHADHPESRTRFMLEAEITGALEHPGIVPVYGLGKYDDGRPYYAMRFIRGDSLQDAIQRFHDAENGKRDPGERAIALRSLLRRFNDVCHAIAYAHSRGVIHRDIKPGNVMLGQFGETLVVDWGLAKPLGSLPDTMPPSIEGLVKPTSMAGSTPTYVGSAVGTPQYMSPEQAAGRIDELGPASDVYSLGATLYCLLVGKPPFEGNDIGRMLGNVVKGEFKPPRDVNSKVPPALSAICAKAMANRVEDRYTTPRELAEDVECWLADEPTTAFPEPWSVRARRWANRHRTGVASAIAGAVVAGVSLAIATVLLAAANAREREARKEAQEQRDEAARNYQLARKAVDRYHTEVSEDVLLHEPGMEPLRRRLLEAAREFYGQFASQRSDDPQVRAELARALFRLGQITADIDAPARGLELQQQARELFQALAESSDADLELLADQATCLHHMGRIQRELDRLGDSRKSCEEALSVWEKLRSRKPEEERYLAEEARTRHGIGNVEQVLRKLERAREEYGRALKIREQLARAHPKREDMARDLAVTRHNLAMVQTSEGSYPEAEENFRQALAAQEKLASAAPNVTQYLADAARTHYNLADLYRLKGQFEESVAEFQAAEACWTRLTREHPTVGRFQAGQARTLLGLCLAHRAAKDEPAAEEAVRKAQEIYTKLEESGKFLPQDRAEVALGYRLIASLRQGIGKNDQARAALQKSVDLLLPLTQGKDALPEYSASLARSWTNLGFLARTEKKLDAAEAAFRKALILWEALVAAFPENGDYAAGLALTQRHLAEIARDGGRTIAALDFLGRAIARLESPAVQQALASQTRQEQRQAYLARAETYTLLNRHVDAVPDWERVVELSAGADQVWARLNRALALGRNKEHGRAATEADALSPLARTTGEALFRLACVYALASDSVAEDQGLPSDQRQMQSADYARKAMEHLRKADQVGFFKVVANRERLEKSVDLQSVRQLEGFADLQARGMD